MKRRLKALYDSLNPAELRRQIDRLLNELIALQKTRPRKKLNKERQRRPKRMSNTNPGHRRLDDTTKAANTFMDRVRLQRLKTDMQTLGSPCRRLRSTKIEPYEYIFPRGNRRYLAHHLMIQFELKLAKLSTDTSLASNRTPRSRSKLMSQEL